MPRLAQLIKLSTAILASQSPQQVLQATCQAAVQFFEVGHCGFVLFDERLETGRVYAEFPDLGEVGRVIPVRGAAAAERFVTLREPLVIGDVTADQPLGAGREILLNQDIRSTLLVPVIYQGRLLGSLGLDSVGRTREFTAVEVELCRSLAEQAATALEIAQALEQARKQAEVLEKGQARISDLARLKDDLANVIDNGPTGVIAVDQSGRIVVLNRQAEKIIGYRAADVLGAEVTMLYVEPEEPRRIGAKLHQSEAGRLTEYDTFMRHRDGESVPIRLTAFWLYNARGQRCGSVGYFDHTLRHLADRHALLLEAPTLVEREDGLPMLAEKMLRALPHTFCRILLLDEHNQMLRVVAACLNANINGGLQWQEGAWQSVKFNDWPGLIDVLNRTQPLLLRSAEIRQQQILKKISAALNIRHPLQALLIVPLHLDEQLVGFLEIGEHRSAAPHQFTAGDRDLVTRVATQITAPLLINRRKEELIRLHQATLEMAEELDLPQLEQNLVKLAKDILRADATLFLRYEYAHDRFVPQEMMNVGVPPAIWEQFAADPPRPTKLTKEAIKLGYLLIPDLKQVAPEMFQAEHRKWFEEMEMVSLEVIALKVREEPVGFLLAGYRTTRVFGEAHKQLVESFSTAAALSLKKAVLFAQIKQSTEIATTIAQATAHGKRTEVLTAIAQKTRNIIRCDAVTLYVYNPLIQRLEYPPTTDGLSYPKEATTGQHPSQLVRDSLWRAAPELIEDVTANAKFKDTPFAHREGIKSLAVFPLKAAGQTIGVMFANYRSRHVFTDEEVANIQLFADQTSTVIFNAQFYLPTVRQAKVLEGLLEAGKAITRSLQLPETLRAISDQALQMFRGADQYHQCFTHIVELKDDTLSFVAASPAEELHKLRAEMALVNLPRPEERIGINGLVAKTGQVKNVGDVQSDPDVFRPRLYINSQLSVPLFIGERVMGVLTIEHPDREAFDEEDEKHAEALAAQAALALQNARAHALVNEHKARLDLLHHATQVLDNKLKLSETHQAIVEEARKLVSADFAVLWVFDQGQNQFISDNPIVAGGSPDLLTKLKADPPQPRRTSYTLLERGWMAEPDLESAESSMSVETRARFMGYGIKSFQGVALKVGDEAVGVLYLHYREPRRFEQYDQHLLESFAAFAALSLRKTGLLQQISDEQETARKVTELTALAKSDFLSQVVEATRERINCDVIVLYSYDPDTKRLNPEPFNIGVREPEKARFGIHMAGPKSPIVHGMLEKRELYVIEDVSQDELFHHSRFAAEEGIQSLAVAPLLTTAGNVGVMFFNYRYPHRFTENETTRIKHFASQVAIAVRNWQLLAKAQKRADVLTGLFNATKEVMRDVDDVEKTLRVISEQALQIVGACADKGCFSHIGVIEETGLLNFVAASSEEIRRQLKPESVLPSFDESPTGRPRGIPQRAVKTRKTQNVFDVNKDPDYYVLKSEINSQLSVPLILENEQQERLVVGVLTIEHPDLAAFSEEDERNVESLAAQAAIAVRNARRYQALKRAQSLAWMGIGSATQRHTIANRAISLSMEAASLQQELERQQLGDEIIARTAKLRRHADQLKQMPALPSLTTAEGRQRIKLNDFLAKQAEKWRAYGYYPDVSLQLDLQAYVDATITVSPEWLEQALSTLVDNAMAATEGRPKRKVSIGSRNVSGLAEIFVTDNGFGIPPEIRILILREPIRKSRGRGMGLLIARLIVDTYDGQLRCTHTGDDGTTMMISLPLC